MRDVRRWRTCNGNISPDCYMKRSKNLRTVWITKKGEIEKRWVENIKELYDDPKWKKWATPTGEQGPPILLSEVKAVIGTMRPGKAPGIDEIPTECLANLWLETQALVGVSG